MSAYRALVRGVNFLGDERRFGDPDPRRDAKEKDDAAMSVAVMMNQMFRLGVGLAIWCAVRQILMVWST